MKKPHIGVDDRIYKELFLASPVASYICDGNGYLIAYNRAAELLWGRCPKLQVEKWSGALESYYPDGRPMPNEATPMASAMRESNEQGDGQELIIARPDGTRRSVLAFPKRLRATTGELIGAYNTLVDITTHKQYEEKQAMLSEIVHSSDDAIVSKNLEGIIMSWNKGAEQIFGYREAEILGKSIYTLIPSYLHEEEDTITGL